MPRQPRQESSTGYYHVMLRGINRDFFFKGDRTKEILMELLQEQQGEEQIELTAWCIMDNHVHLLLKADKASMSKALKIISLKFAAKYNRYHSRTGPVFGDRYRSESIEDETYLLGALRYIHQNPIKAGIADDISDYRWSSYHAYVSDSGGVSAKQREFMLGLFGNNQAQFRQFHDESDDTEFLEMREDVVTQRREKALFLLEQFCIEFGVESARQVHGNPDRFAELCRRITQDAKLTLRQAAELLETSHLRVFEALQNRD